MSHSDLPLNRSYGYGTLVSQVGTNLVILKIHDLAGINFSDFIISSSYQVLFEFPIVFSNDEPSTESRSF